MPGLQNERELVTCSGELIAGCWSLMSAVHEGYQVYCSGNGRWFAYKLIHQQGFPKNIGFLTKREKKW